VQYLIRAGFGGGHHSAARDARGEFGQSGKRLSHTQNIIANAGFANSVMFMDFRVNF
jgi:hypothetical protein